MSPTEPDGATSGESATIGGEDAGQTGPQGETRIGRYTILETLGHGGMGTVYLAQDPVIGRKVALKVITARPETDEEARQYRERFLREAQAAGAMVHPNIVSVHDIGLDPAGGQPFIVMEHVEGQDLKQIIRTRAPLAPLDAIRVTQQIAAGLDFAHGRGIVHRDIKPANVLISGSGVVKLTDFGVARLPGSDLTQSDQMVGSPGFMSPEQLRGAPVDGRSDLFALGVILYQLLTGKSPFDGESVSEVLYRISTQPVDPPSEIHPDVSPDFDPVLEKALSKDPEARFQTGREMIEALSAVAARLPVGGAVAAAAEATLPPLAAVVDEAGARGPHGAIDPANQAGAGRGRPRDPESTGWWNTNNSWRLGGFVALLLLTFVGVNYGIHTLMNGPFGRVATDAADRAADRPGARGGAGEGVAAGPLAAIGGAIPGPAAAQPAIAAAGDRALQAPTAPDRAVVPVCSMTFADPTEVARVLFEARRDRGAAVAAPERPAGRIRLDFNHQLPAGRVVVLVDGRTVLSKPFDVPKGKKAGRLTHLLSVPAGRHGVEVRVLGAKGAVRAKSKIAGTVARNVTAVLTVEEKSGSKKPLRLDWENEETEDGARPRS